MVTIVIAVVTAMFASFLKIMTALLSLPAMLAVTANCLLQIFFGFVNPPFAFSIVAIESLNGKSASQNQSAAQQGCKDSGFFAIEIEHNTSLMLVMTSPGSSAADLCPAP